MLTACLNEVHRGAFCSPGTGRPPWPKALGPRALGLRRAACRLRPPPPPPWRFRSRLALFGLATIGHGWGMRVVAVVMNGAIPVFLEHKYHQAWSDVMDPAEYGFVGDITDIPDLVEKLRAVPAAELDAKFQKILEIAPAFVWDGTDGQAYDYALRAIDKIMAGKRARGDLPV